MKRSKKYCKVIQLLIGEKIIETINGIDIDRKNENTFE
jgi:hypothetical protein